MVSDALLYLKRFCLSAAMLSFIYGTFISIHRNFLILEYDLTHFHQPGREFELLSVLASIIIMIPIFGIPYWLVLALSKWKSRIAKYTLILYDVFFLFGLLFNFFWLCVDIFYGNHPYGWMVLFVLYCALETALVSLAILLLYRAPLNRWLSE